jgi:hypothetical protein
LEEYRRTRLLMAEIRNLMRGPKDPWQPADEILPLPGDGLLPAAAPESAEDIEALWAELDARDAALLNPKNG